MKYTYTLVMKECMKKWQKFIKITSVGMAAAKCNEKGRNGNV